MHLFIIYTPNYVLDMGSAYCLVEMNICAKFEENPCISIGFIELKQKEMVRQMQQSNSSIGPPPRSSGGDIQM